MKKRLSGNFLIKDRKSGRTLAIIDVDEGFLEFQQIFEQVIAENQGLA